LGDWKVNSSPRTVTRVNVWEKALLLLEEIFTEVGEKNTHVFHQVSTWGK
jgi:hypothetical protein